jgi:thiol-disulfide isomerase/thioredoxin
MLNSLRGLVGMNSKKSRNGSKNNNAPTNNVSVRSPEEIEDLEKVMMVGPVTLVFVHADWCGHCQTYKPIWNELENTPGRTVNMATIHHDMVEKSPTLKNANIPGYPSVLKVYPSGKIEEYKGTNSMPNIRDKSAMTAEVTAPTQAYAVSQNTKRNVGNVTRVASNNVMKPSKKNNLSIGATIPPTLLPLPQQKGGSLYAALSQALMQAGPAVFLLGASQALPPKRSSGNSTRRTRKASNRRSNRNKSRKN